MRLRTPVQKLQQSRHCQKTTSFLRRQESALQGVTSNSEQLNLTLLIIFTTSSYLQIPACAGMTIEYFYVFLNDYYYIKTTTL